ncbi:ATP-dependent helicase fft2 [Cyphellophora attinorum]|uniref:ATP-dependent helicase fft2 n=1 Tax=Cyphellophora attinorum TaxID=1664694 RepID=A0A0N0NRE9_9EURO|nr:ATP-dependent helicase fft2 [Phialophora attinorum]KPI45011.1 ATP-dependent helicase fft2 [Phialophora attinorum]
MELHTLCAKNAVIRKFALTNNEWLASGKVAKMLELLRSYIAEGSRTLIFSQFTMVLDILEVVFDHEEINYFRLDGSTRVNERQDLINEFSKEGNNTPVFMLSTKAGGAGINLASANKVIIFDSGFNPQDDIQAENRAHRIGQKKPVEVVRLVSKGTVEEAIYKMGLTKVELDQRVAGGMSGTNTPPNEAQETAADQDKKMTKAEVEGLKMVENMFFEGLGTSGQKAEPGIDKDAVMTTETTEAEVTPDTANGVEEEVDDVEIVGAVVKREVSELPDRPKRTCSKITTASQGSGNSSTRSSRTNSRR